MKKIIFSIVAAMTLFVSSCSDMLDVEGGREIEASELNQASDSAFYAFGILQAMQQAADAYVLQNEVRGDLLDVTQYSDNNLRQLANFSATTANAYDSAYVYYRVINNCNYYLAHRDTAIYDGSYNVTRNEYAAVLTFRAWAYLQLARTYGTVKFITQPLVNLSDIQNDNSPMLGITEIVKRLADDGDQALRKFTDCDVPYGSLVMNSVYMSRQCIPVNVMLGELYLEAGRYAEAADHYFQFLLKTELVNKDMGASPDYDKYRNTIRPSYFPEFNTIQNAFAHSWETYCLNSISIDLHMMDKISVVTFASNNTMGVTSSLPLLFGYDYYYQASLTDDERLEATDEIYQEELQLKPSSAYYLIADSSRYFYTSRFYETDGIKGDVPMGDQRGYARLGSSQLMNDTNRYITTYRTPEVILYRGTTIWLHLAEALNRLGYPDAAFAILKDGISTDLLNRANFPYVTDATIDLLQTRYPFLTGEAALVFGGEQADDDVRNYGIHRHGCGDAEGTAGVGSTYQLDTEVARKVANLEKLFPELGSMDPALAATPEDSLAMLVNAVEDLLCDEYAMELAFEGSRYADLMRLARHKNASSPSTFGANFGGKWLANKLAFKLDGNASKLEQESNWYLPLR